MRTPRPRKRKAKRERRLGRVSPEIERNLKKELHDNFTDEVPGHFMYNEEADAIQQVLKLPDISVPSSPRKSTSKNEFCLPPINAEDRGSSGERKNNENSTTKLPRISKDVKHLDNSSNKWLEQQDICSVSWGKALDVLDKRSLKDASPIKELSQKRRRKEKEIQQFKNHSKL